MGTYCTVYDVAQVMGLPLRRFTEDSLPTKNTVEEIISMMEDYVDRYCRTAWRERTNYEMEGGTRTVSADAGYEYHKLIPVGFSGWLWQGRPVFTKYRPLKPLDPVRGDSVQIFTGMGWEEWLGVKIMSPTADYWVDYDTGRIFFRRVWWFSKLQGWTVRLRYRFGYTSVPKDIRYATALLAAAHLVESGDYTNLLPEGATNIVVAREKTQLWTARAHSILERYKHVVVPD